MAQRTSRTATKAGARTPPARVPVTRPAPPPQGAAARRRIQQRSQQRRRQQIAQRVRRLEAVLPSAGAAWPPALPSLPSLTDVRSWGDRLRWPLHPLRTRSLLLLLAAVLLAAALVTWVHTDDRWFLYREDARFEGLTYLSADELWPLSQIDGWNLFWLDTEAVRDRLLQNPYVADADVYISPLAQTVTIDVTEAQPIALWVTDNGTRWLLPDGTAVEPRGSTPAGLLQIVDGGAVATAPGAALGAAIDAAVLLSAQSLAERLPGSGGSAPLRYNRQIGLNFQMQDKPYWVYWGGGDHVERKLQNLAAAVELLEQGKLEGTVIDVRFERPYVK